MKGFIFDTRVSYDDIDSQDKLTLKGVMSMMQEAAIIDSSLCGLGLKEIHTKHVAWILNQWHIRITGEAEWNDDLRVETWVQSMDRLKCTRNFEITDMQGETVAIAESVWVLVNVKSGHPVKLTDDIANLYNQIGRPVFADKIPRIPAAKGERISVGTVTRRDLDTNHHVNNRIYVELAQDALPEKYRNSAFTEIMVHYHRQMLLGASVECCCHCQNGIHIVDIFEKGCDCCCAQVIFIREKEPETK